MGRYITGRLVSPPPFDRAQDMLSSPATRLCRNCQTCTHVILSASEESLFSDAYEERSFGYVLRMTLRPGLPEGESERENPLPPRAEEEGRLGGIWVHCSKSGVL
jgi:hypothetical protein